MKKRNRFNYSKIKGLIDFLEGFDLHKEGIPAVEVYEILKNEVA